jgi:predicted dehydrogenase
VFKIGVIGSGYMANKHLNVLKKMSYVQLRSILTTKRSEDIGRKLAGELGMESYTEIERFLESDIDIVVIASPNRLHFEHTIKSLEAGKDVLCEKPLSYFEEEILEIQELSRKKGKKVCVGMNCRFREQYNYFQPFIERLGEIFFIKGTYIYYSKDDILKGTKQYLKQEPKEKEIFLHGGGIHCLDLLNWYGGIPKRIFATASNTALRKVCGPNDTYSLLIEYTNRIKAELFTSTTLIRSNDFHLEIYGTEGSIIGTRYYLKEGSEIVEREHRVSQPKIDLELQFEDFFDAIEKDREPLNSIENALLNARVCNGAEKSILEKKIIEI